MDLCGTMMDLDWWFGWIYVYLCRNLEIDRLMIAVVVIFVGGYLSWWFKIIENIDANVRSERGQHWKYPNVQQTGGKSVASAPSSVVKGFINLWWTFCGCLPEDNQIRWQSLKFSLGLDHLISRYQNIQFDASNFSSKTVSELQIHRKTHELWFLNHPHPINPSTCTAPRAGMKITLQPTVGRMVQGRSL